MHRRHLTALSLFIFTAASLAATRPSAETLADQTDLAAQHELMVSRAIDYLRVTGQQDDGSYSPQTGPAVTALITTAILRHGRSVDDPLVVKSLRYLESFVQPDGGIYKPGSTHRNYETCLSMLCFAQANADHRYDEAIERAESFIKRLQFDEDEGHGPESYYHGGAGYGSHSRPDLSNTSFLIEALKAAGAGPDDEHMQKALHFVSMCQNLESPYNTSPFAAKNPDGGFYYTVAAGGQSQAPPTPDMAPGALRSYGSMTYAGLKSMIYAGVEKDDPRVTAALDWIRDNYDLTANPGLGDAGLYYYYHTFAKALAARDAPELVDAGGVSHRWQDDLIRQLAARQNRDGSWANANPRWLEGDPNLVTGYCLLALSYCRPATE